MANTVKFIVEGTSNPQFDADIVAISDSGGYYGSSMVEGALQEIGSSLPTSLDTIAEGSSNWYWHPARIAGSTSIGVTSVGASLRVDWIAGDSYMPITYTTDNITEGSSSWYWKGTRLTGTSGIGVSVTGLTANAVFTAWGTSNRWTERNSFSVSPVVDTLTSKRVLLAGDSKEIADDADLSFDTSIDTINSRWGNIGYPYGSFSSGATQGIAGTSQAYAITYTTTDCASGTSLLTSSQIQVGATGAYFISYSAVARSTAPNKTLDIWLAVGGSYIDNSNTKSKFVGSANERVVTVTYIYPLNAGQYVELYMCSDDTGTILEATDAKTAPVRPACPSIITTVNKISS